MFRYQTSQTSAGAWVGEHLKIARKVALSLKRRYGWLDWDDLYSYSLWGMTLAAGAYRSETGVPFEQFARGKAMFVAIDAMREDRVLRRASGRKRPMFFSCSDGGSGDQCGFMSRIADRRSSDNIQAVDARDQVRCMLSRLDDQGRQELLMHYADGLTFKEIARVFHKSESAISIHHKNLIARLRRMRSSPPARA